jgi:hypothetical protein
MNMRNSVYNAQLRANGVTEGFRTDYTPFINALREEEVLNRINHTFVTQDVYQSLAGDSLGRDGNKSVLRVAASSPEAKWLLGMLKKWCLWEQYLILQKSMHSSYAQLSSRDISVLWRSIIYR